MAGKIKYILCIYENVAMELVTCSYWVLIKRPEVVFLVLLFFFFSFSVCVWYVHVYIHVCMYMGTYVCRCPCTWRFKVDVGNHPPYLLHLIQWAGVSQSNTEFVKMASLDSQLALGILFLPSESGIIGRPLCPPGIYMGSGVPNIGLHPCMAST